MGNKFTYKLGTLLICLLASVGAFAQETSVNGIVVDAVTGEPLPGTTIIVKGKVLGTTADSNGEFNFAITLPPPFTLVFSSVGYEIKEVEIAGTSEEIEVRLRSQSLIEPDFVVSASSMEESVLQSPTAISKYDQNALKLSPYFSFYEGLSDLEGVQSLTSGLMFQAINTRGFADIGNNRFVQMIDGADNAPPGLNFTLGNFVGVSELDIAEIELIAGAASSLYGPNAFNGILFMNTKNPFDYQGLSAYSKNAVTIDDAKGTNPLVEMGIRFAKVYNDVLGLKINVSATRGTEWTANDLTDIDLSTINPVKGSLETNPSYDGVNVYGDEIATTLNLDELTGSPTGTFGNIRVARTGYQETQLFAGATQNIKADAALHYRPTDNIEIIGSYRFGTGTTLFQGANRYAFRDLYMHQIKLEFKTPNFYIRGYSNLENSGNSYDIRFAAWNINRLWKSDKQWFSEYAAAYLGGIPGVQGFDHLTARGFADRNRIEPGTDAFQIALDSVTSDPNLLTGSQFLDRSEFYHFEGQYDFKDFVSFMDLQIGGNFRNYRLISDGTLFNDKDAAINIREFGAYARGAFKFMDNKVKLAWAIRYDKNMNFEGQITPRAALIYSTGKNKEHNLRFAFQTGFRNPSVQNQFINLNLGVARLLGSVEQNINDFSTTIPTSDTSFVTVTGNSVYSNSYTAASVQAFAQTGDPSVLQPIQLDFVQPERVSTYEVGYRGVINKRLFLDLHFYSSRFTQFIATTNVVHPLTGSVADLTGVADLAANRTAVFQLYSNATGTVNSQGLGLNFEYALSQGFRLSGFYNYATFDYGDADPNLVPGFNTPEHRFGVGLSNNNIYKGVGFAIRYRWTDSYEWQSAFGSAMIDSYDLVNAQISYRIPKSKVMLKFGGNNILGSNYRTAFGAPTVGSIYYFSIYFDQLNDF